MVNIFLYKKYLGLKIKSGSFTTFYRLKNYKVEILLSTSTDAKEIERRNNIKLLYDDTVRVIKPHDGTIYHAPMLGEQVYYINCSGEIKKGLAFGIMNDKYNIRIDESTWTVGYRQEIVAVNYLEAFLKKKLYKPVWWWTFQYKPFYLSKFAQMWKDTKI